MENIITHTTFGRYPVGDSSFPSIRELNQVYVDKTALLYQLTHESKYNFLSRPRRFGKSLMLSTLRAYFSGRKELFEGLAMAQLEKEWIKYPVIHLTMGGKDFSSTNALNIHLNNQLSDNEHILGLELSSGDPDTRFYNLIRKASDKFGQKAVILIDEYDKPMLDTRHLNDELHEGVRSIIRGFYGCIKESSEYIRFVMITGVTKFSHVNIFSGLNNLRDISLTPEYNALCGISESEIAEYFKKDMEVFAERNGITPEETAQRFKLHYDGYRFAGIGENIYNPFSVVNAFVNMEFGNYWFSSGTSYHLVKEMEQSNFDFQSLEGINITKDSLMGVLVTADNIVALLYQAGYLTIKEYYPESQSYDLGFPNKEVSASFFNELLNIKLNTTPGIGFSALKFYKSAMDGKPEEMMSLLKLALSKFSYHQVDAKAPEKHFNTLLMIINMAIGLAVESEVNTSAGRIDMVIKTRRFIYLMEFKVNSYPKKAMEQINQTGYADKYCGDPRTLYKIGANFSKKTRNLTGWIIEQG